MNSSPKFESHLPQFSSAASLAVRWIAILLVATIYSPTAYLISRLVRGEYLVGGLGLALWLPVYAVLLAQLHKHGFMRLWLSALLSVIASAVFCFVFLVTVRGLGT